MKEPQPGSFSIGVTNDQSSDHILVTVSIPKIIDLPYFGPATIETICYTTAACIAPWLIWFARRTARRFRKSTKDKKEEALKKNEFPAKPESPVKATKWESSSSRKKLDDFMNDKIRPARASLRHVEDPDTVEKRMAKRAKIKQEQAKKPKGPLGLSKELLQNSRKSLRQSTGTSLATYLEQEEDDEEDGRSPRSVAQNIRLLQGRLEKDIKDYGDLVKIDSESDEEDGSVESGSKCVIS